MNSGFQNVAVIDDDPEIIESLTHLLQAADYSVEGYISGINFLGTDIRNFKGCVLLDVRMPEKDGMKVLSEALAVNPNLYIVMMSGHGDIPMAVRALKMGAVDFIEKPFHSSQLINAIEKASKHFEQLDATADMASIAKSRMALLTRREREIIERMVDGKANKIIAFELGISIRTVENHRAHILSKMQVKSLADLVKLYILATGA